MEPDQLAQAIGHHLEGTLDGAETEALAGAARADESIRDSLIDQRLLDRWLRERVRTPTLADRVMVRLRDSGTIANRVMARLPDGANRRRLSPRTELRRRSPTASFGWVATALILILVAFGIGGWLVIRTRNPVALAILVAPMAGVSIERSGTILPAGEGSSLRRDDRLICVEGALATVVYPDGSRLELSSGTASWRLPTSLASPGQELTLERGQLSASIAIQPAGHPFAVLTPHALVTVIGTRFTLGVTPASTSLAVSSGVVRCQRLGDHSVIDVTAGGSTVAPMADLPTTPATTQKSPTTSLHRLLPLADSYVSSTSPSTSFGKERVIQVSAGTPHGDLVGCLRFSLPTGPTRSATLVLQCRGGTGRVQVFRSADVSWDEATVRYYHIPARDPEPLAAADVSKGTVRIELPSTITDRNGGQVTLLLVAVPTAALIFASREETGAEPVLEIDSVAPAPDPAGQAR